jgi:CheY-like chemotaxis protein
MFIKKEQLAKEKLLHGLRILVAEQQPDHRDLLNFILTTEDAVVIPVTSASDALQVWSQQSIDMMFISTNILTDPTLVASMKTDSQQKQKPPQVVAVFDTSREAS